MWLQLLRVFGGNLNNNLQVLAEIGGKHLLQAFKGLINREAAKVVDSPFRVKKVGVGQDALYIVDIGVVLQSLYRGEERRGED